MKKFPWLLSVICLCAISGTIQAEPIISASATAFWNQNITRSPYDEYRFDSWSWDVAAEAEWHNQVSRDLSLSLATSAGLETYQHYSGLNHSSLGLSLSGRHKFGLGTYAPSLKADLIFSGNWFRETMRSGTRMVAGLSWSRRWNDSWQTVLSADYQINHGRAQVFDYKHGGLGAELRYDLTERWQISGGFKREWGDQMTYAWVGPGVDFPYVYEIWDNTTDVPTYGPDWQAYTMEAHADTVWFAFSPALSGDRSLPIRFEQTIVVGHGESYPVRSISISFVQRF